MKKRTFILVHLLMIATMILSACRETVITPVPELGYTPAPGVSPTPLPPLTPRLLQRSPERGEEQPPDAPIVLAFDQAMDSASVEAAFRIEPAVPGALAWDDARTLRFAPAAGLAQDTAYRVTVDTTARSAQNLPLEQPVEFRFYTVGHLVVTAAYPLADAEDVPTDTVVRVIFNRPVVPLTSLADQLDMVDPIVFDPPLSGRGAWINTSIYEFTPRDRLRPGARYTARIATGLVDTSGATLAEDYVWSFATELPAVIDYSPAEGQQHVAPDATVQLTFNQPMDRRSVQERFGLTKESDRSTVQGSISWQGETMIFRPARPLALGEEYTARLGYGTASADGESRTDRDYIWSFDVISLPTVVSITPEEGAEVYQGEGMYITFSSPISPATFLKAITITPPLDIYPYWMDDDTVVSVGFYARPSTSYTVTLTEGILGRHGHRVEGRTVHTFRTRPADPVVQLSLVDMVGTYNAYTEPRVVVGHRNVSRLDMALYSVTREEFVSLTRQDAWERWDKYRPAADAMVSRWSRRVSAQVDALSTLSAALATEDGGRLPPGIYYVQVSAPEATYPARHLLVVSPMNLTLKSTASEALVWATDLRDGQPMRGVDVEVYNEKGALVGNGTTDANGVATMDLPRQQPWEPITVLAHSEAGIGAVSRYWSRGVEAWDFGLPYEPMRSDYVAHFYTDRRIYRPGQTVHFKAVLRADRDGQYALPPSGEPVSVYAVDQEGRQFWQETLTVNDMGSISGSLTLAENAPLGYYNVRADYGEQSFAVDFQVAEYRRPEFQVQVNLDHPDYVHGDTIQVAAEVDYYFGGPVANAEVRWRVLRQPYEFDRWQGQGYYSFADHDVDDMLPYMAPLGDFVAEGTGETDGQGRFAASIPADLADLLQSQRYTIEVSVTDVNNQEVSARTSAVVHKGTFYIGLTAPLYVGVAGREHEVQVVTVDTQGEIQPRQSLQVVFYRREWLSVREQADNGNYYWSNTVSDTAVATRTLTTDAGGIASTSFVPPEGGTYRAVATGLDEHENEVRSALYLWVSGSDYISWGQRNTDRIELITDKKEYRPGETAEILIPSPYQGPVRALMTIERGGIMEYRVLTLQTNSERIRVPIRAEHAPNVYVSVTIVRAMEGDPPLAGFKVGYVEIPVSTEQQELDITVTPRGESPYRPRDSVTYDILARDHSGRGVEAEVSLQLVDLAVEALVGGEAANIVQSFYRQRGLGISTATTLALSVDRRNLEYSRDGKGGGGGAADGMVRSFFPETAYWNPVIRTDAQGKASVTLNLPDNLTTWRMTAQAATARTEVGRARSDIVSTLDVLVRPVVPRFMVIGDRPELGAVIHNNTATELQATVSLVASGVTVNQGQRTVLVPAGDRVTVSWPALVGAVDQATLSYSVSAGRHADAVTLRLPVYHPSTPEVVGTAGIVQDRVIERVLVPRNADTALGELTVQIEPSLAAGMREGLEYLRAFPFDCVEQAVSRFLPNVVTYRALGELGMRDRELEAELPRQVGVGIQRLYTLQNLDGGWGWWANHPSSPTISAYALLGLVEAERAGFSIDATVKDRAIKYLYGWLGTRPRDSRDDRDTRATVLYILAEAGRGDMGRTAALYDDGGEMSLYARAYLASALHILRPDETTRTDALVSRLMNEAILSASGAHWEEKSVDKWAMTTDTRTTAIVLRALVRLQPDSPLLANAVRWLMLARSSGRWETTQENAWAIMALTDYLVSTGELQADYVYDLWVNNDRMAGARITAETLGRPVRAEVPVAALHADGDNAVIIERGPADAPGRMYYSAYLRYYLPVDAVRALNRGLVVQRQFFLESDPTRPITRAQVNDVITVRLTLIAPNDAHYLVLEDPFPAGLEAIDTSLATSRTPLEREGLRRDEPMDWGWHRDWATHTELRDEKLALFADYLPRGTYEYTYSLRCTTPGEFMVLPATAYEMYMPDVFGRSDGSTFIVSGR
jgi:hypothetical protein